MQGHIEQWIVTYAYGVSAGMNRISPVQVNIRNKKIKGVSFTIKTVKFFVSEVTIEENN